MSTDESDRILNALSDLARDVRDNSVSLARLESTIEAQRSSTATFWATHWPQAMDRIERLEVSCAETNDNLASLRVRVAHLGQARAKRTTAMVAASGVTVAAIVEAVRAFLEGQGPHK